MKRPVRKVLSIENLIRRGVPKSFHNITINDFHDSGIDKLVRVRKFMENYLSNIDEMFNKNKGIYFYGSNGVGKSMLASLIVKEAYIHRYTSKRISFVDYIKCYTKIWDATNLEEREDLETQFYTEAKSVEFLVLEEVGKEIETKIAIPILEDCLRYREEHGLVTIICTNLEPKELDERYGNSVKSLIKGHMIIIRLVDYDHRKEVFNNARK